MCNPDFLRLGVPGRDEAGDRLPKRGDDGTDCVASDFLDKMLMALPRHNRLELIALPVIIVTHGKVKNTKNTIQVVITFPFNVPSWSRLPEVPLRFALSEPAKSTKFN